MWGRQGETDRGGQGYLYTDAVSGATQCLNDGLARVSHGEHPPITLYPDPHTLVETADWFRAEGVTLPQTTPQQPSRPQWWSRSSLSRERESKQGGDMSEERRERERGGQADRARQTLKPTPSAARHSTTRIKCVPGCRMSSNGSSAKDREREERAESEGGERRE